MFRQVFSKSSTAIQALGVGALLLAATCASAAVVVGQAAVNRAFNDGFSNFVITLPARPCTRREGPVVRAVSMYCRASCERRISKASCSMCSRSSFEGVQGRMAFGFTADLLRAECARGR